MRKRTRVVLVVGLLSATALAGLMSVEFYWRIRPEAAFERITGRQLPAGVTAKAYRWKMSDNLFHVTHYWMLSAGDAEPLRAVVSDTAFVRSDADAQANVPDVDHLFGVRKSKVVAGYEWEAPRNRWYFVFEDERSALYAH